MKNVYSRGGVLIGNVPDTWTVNKTLRCLDMPITDGPHETPSAVDEVDGIPFVSAEAVSCGNGSIDFEHIWGFISKEYYKECCKKYIPRIDDIYMIKSGATTGKVAIVDTERIFTIWSPLAVFRANTFIIKPKYLFYFLQSPMYLSQVELGWNYGTQQNIGMRALEQLYISYPSLTEQQQIVHFLDRKCTAIDTAIEKTKKSIEKLEEYKKAVITKAVTKGIDPNAKMKDSGVEWCPQIPEHWSVVNPKALFSQRTERILPGDKQLTASQEHGIIYQDEYTKATGSRVVAVIRDFSILKHVEPNDFVISMRSFQGGLEYSEKRGCISSAYVMLIPNTKYVYPPFYRWFFKSSKYINALQSTSNFVRDGQAMRYSHFIQIPLFVIPLTEQKQIANYLESKVNAIMVLIQKKQMAIAKWEEYKKSLIYYAVTGKIDCRGEKL